MDLGETNLVVTGIVRAVPLKSTLPVIIPTQNVPGVS